MPALHEATQNTEARVTRWSHAGVRGGSGITDEGRFVPALPHLQCQVGVACVHGYRILHHAVVHHVETG